ncbi:hypothetical protein AAE478_009038 [Parahypoxylon ruwenzoriense]
MWLLNARDWKLYEFVEADAPPYAILSHTWGAAEVSFADVRGTRSGYRRKNGWRKIMWCFSQALTDGLEYVWVDTCCINKSSSAELSEAINSMFRWYEKSQVCYAYLVDVRSDDKPDAANSLFRQSRWFTRGWTLQELIAPALLIFYDVRWNVVGTRYALREVISSITGISRAVLEGSAISARRALRTASIAQKMSWAAGRSTTRPEDMAYCLMGIFEVNMPMLYGEETKAFTRLQEEIMKNSDDQSILAWGFRRPQSKLWGASHALATSPSDFAACSDLVFSGVPEADASFAMTQRGLALHLPVLEQYADREVVYCLLDCTVANVSMDGYTCILALPLLRIDLEDSPSVTRTDEYTRLALTTPLWVPTRSLGRPPKRTVYLPRLRVYEQPTQRLRLNMGVEGITLPAGYFIAGIWPPAVTFNDLLQFKASKSDPYSYIMIHIARECQPGFILSMRYKQSLYEQSSTVSTYIIGSRPLSDNELITNTIRAVTAQVSDLRIGDIDSNSKLAELGIHSLASMEMIHLLRQRTGLPVYPDSLLGCTTLRDVERNLILLRRAASMSGHQMEADLFQWSPQVGVEDVSFALIRVEPHESLLGYITSPMESWKTWARMNFERPRRVGESRHQKYYEANLAFGSRGMVNVSLMTSLGQNKLSLGLKSLNDEGVS